MAEQVEVPEGAEVKTRNWLQYQPTDDPKWPEGVWIDVRDIYEADPASEVEFYDQMSVDAESIPGSEARRYRRHRVVRRTTIEEVLT